MNRNERTVKAPTTFITERCFWGAGGGGGVVTVTQRLKIVTVGLHLTLALVEGEESRPSFNCDQ